MVISHQSSLSKRTRSHPSHNHEPAPVTFSDDRTPSARLNRAIQSSNLNLVKRLLSTHCQPHSTDHPDQDHELSLNKSRSKKYDLNPRNQDPVTRKTSLILATENSNFEICKLLIEEYHVDSDFISRDLENNTILHLAAAQGLDDIISLYHSHYPHVLDWANSEGMTALHVASQKGNESTVSLLLDFQADVELTDNEGNTSLHYAAAWGHLKIVLLLIDRGSPFWAKNNQTFTASDYAFSFSIQSALQESARAHFESKKQQRHHRQQRDRDKDRPQRTGPTSTSNLKTDSPTVLSRPTNRLGMKDSYGSNSSLRLNNMMNSNPMIPKISTSPTSSASSHPRHIPPPLAPAGLSPSTSSKPLSSPTNSISAARTVSHLISKDLEAIQDFRTRSSSLANSTNHYSSSSSVLSHVLPQSSPTLLTPTSSESPTTTGQSSSSASRLLPLQLVSGTGAGKVSLPTLRGRSSTGNLDNHAHPDGLSRNRAGSTESETAAVIGLGGREGLSRLRYLKSSTNSSSSLTGSNSSATINSYSSPHLALPPRQALPVLETVPGSPGSETFVLRGPPTINQVLAGSNHEDAS